MVIVTVGVMAATRSPTKCKRFQSAPTAQVLNKSALPIPTSLPTSGLKTFQQAIQKWHSTRKPASWVALENWSPRSPLFVCGLRLSTSTTTVWWAWSRGGRKHALSWRGAGTCYGVCCLAPGDFRLSTLDKKKARRGSFPLRAEVPVGLPVGSLEARAWLPDQGCA